LSFTADGSSQGSDLLRQKKKGLWRGNPLGTEL
jgi:hypothetical protein